LASNEISVKNLAILFTDIHNFSIAMKHMPEDQHIFIQEMYEQLGEIVVDHGGGIIKYIGDSLLCVFPQGSETRAVECALKLRKTFSGLVRDRGLPPDTELEIGISSGQVVTGVFGHRSLRQRDVFGECVNQAAMIGHHRAIALTEPVHDRIRTHFKTRELADLKVKWLDRPLKRWEVLEPT